MPLWEPTTEEDLRVAAHSGTLDESMPGLELKREIGTSTGANKELGRDLASLAVAGGQLLIGILDASDRDAENVESALYPIPTDGLPEKIEQIAAMRCDPPLVVSCRAIVSEFDANMGYVLVDVPTSPMAPHMSDGRYWSRGEHSKRHLSDHEVEVLISRREQLNRSAESELHAYVARDPWVAGGAQQTIGHQYAVAVPLQADATMLLNNVAGDGWETWLRAFVAQATVPGQSWSPDLTDALNPDRRGDGWAMTSHSLQTGRRLGQDADEGSLYELELAEAGTVRMFSGRASDGRGSDQDQLFFLEVAVVGNTMQLIRLVTAVSEATNYGGMWALGVSVNHLRGSTPQSLGGAISMLLPVLSEDGYEQMTRASTVELARQPESVLERLVGRLMRSAGCHHVRQLDIFLRPPTDD